MNANVIFLAVLVWASAVHSFQLTNINQLNEAKQHKQITIKNLNVPAGQTLELVGLKPGTHVKFSGRVTFGYQQWEGPLIKIQGKNLIIEGEEGNLFDCKGERWWDGLGGNDGKIKPKFFSLKADDSTISNLNVKNLPVHGFSINGCNRVKISGVNINVKDGHPHGKGHNTDGFNVGRSKDVTITNCYVENQDDCLAVNSGEDITFTNNICVGGHGISIGSVGGRKNNDVRNVLVQHCQVIDSANGIRIKTIMGAKGSVTNVTFDDIELKDIVKRGIAIQGNYENKGPVEKDPLPGVPIKDLIINNVRGNVLPHGANYYVWVAGASNWTWNANVTGGKKEMGTAGLPKGVVLEETGTDIHQRSG